MLSSVDRGFSLYDLWVHRQRVHTFLRLLVVYSTREDGIEPTMC